MPIYSQPTARLRAWLFPADDVTFIVRTSARIARFVIPVIEKLIRDDRIGETYRCAVALWERWEAPPLTLYQGEISLCRIHGPLLKGDSAYRPSGGLIETTGFEANLTSEEAHRLDRRLRQAIERTIRTWAEERQGDAHENKLPPDGDVTSLPLEVTSPSGRHVSQKSKTPLRKAQPTRKAGFRNAEGDDA